MLIIPWLKKQYHQHFCRLVLCFSFILVCLLFMVLDKIYPLNRPEQQHQFARVVLDEYKRPISVFADKKGIWRYPISVDDVSPRYLTVLLNYEDRWFWYHPGINPFSILRATWQNIIHNKIISGGSTLSMQVARILHPHQRSYWGKIKQVCRTLQLEWHYSKKEILQIYLNTAPFGGTIEGVQAASYTYLNKPAKQLTHAEAALLAVLPQSPTRFRPDLHNQAAKKARNKVLQRMVDFNIWSQETVNDAMLEHVYPMSFKPKQIAPLFAQRLIKQYPKKSVITSSLNSDLQAQLQLLLTSYMPQMPDRSSAAILVIENKTSAVKAYIGTADYGNTQRFGYIDMIQATRSPGSTLKPFLYGLALDQGLIHAQSLLADVPNTWGSYRPTNFNGAFNGPVSTTQALQRSLNMPAVDLLSRYGANRFVATLDNAGLSLKIPKNKANLAIILGGAGTNLEKLVQTYSAFANEGKVNKLRFLQAELTKKPIARPLLSTASAWVIQDMLAQISRPDDINTFAARVNNTHLAWKTGTSYGYRDSWAIGVNKTHTIGVWLGRPDGTAMPGHFGRITAGPLLFAVADQLNQDDQIIKKPDNVKLTAICWPLGTQTQLQQTQFCQQQKQAWIIDGVIPPTWHGSDADAWQSNIFTYWINAKNNKRVSLDCAITNKKRRQVALWPKVLEPWIKAEFRRHQLIPALDARCKNSSVNSGATLKIMGLTSNSIYRKSGENGDIPMISLKSIGGVGVKHWYINGKYYYQSQDENAISHQLSTTGKQQIMIRDQQGNSDVVTIFVQ